MGSYISKTYLKKNVKYFFTASLLLLFAGRIIKVTVRYLWMKKMLLTIPRCYHINPKLLMWLMPVIKAWMQCKIIVFLSIKVHRPSSWKIFSRISDTYAIAFIAFLPTFVIGIHLRCFFEINNSDTCTLNLVIFLDSFSISVHNYYNCIPRSLKMKSQF